MPAAGRDGETRTSRLTSVLLGAVISAAFIGPGTVTTAASAGAAHGLVLLWALSFSTVACILLQEAAARLAILSGRDLASALVARARERATRVLVVALVGGAIVVGCAAYEAGNILGAVAGAELAVGLPRPLLTLVTGLAAAALLAAGSPQRVATGLAVLVGVMGVAFLVTAIAVAPAPGALVAGAVVPRVPAGSSALVLGLVGTTVVPYNLFLGAALARERSLPELRFGLVVAIGLGGAISMAVVVVGATLPGAFSFEAIGEALALRLGSWARLLFATGLFAAGLSSAVTAPLAAALTARGLAGDDPRRFHVSGWRFRGVWLAVLSTGVAFGLADLRPVPVILLAQAANGVLLPLVAAFLWLAVNDGALAGGERVAGPLANLAMGGVVWASMVLGLAGLARAGAAALGLPAPSEMVPLGAAAVMGTLAAWPLGRRVARLRRGDP